MIVIVLSFRSNLYVFFQKSNFTLSSNCKDCILSFKVSLNFSQMKRVRNQRKHVMRHQEFLLVWVWIFMLDPRQCNLGYGLRRKSPRFLFKIQMWEVSSLPGVFVENWPKFGHQVEYLLKTDRNTKRLSSVAVEAQFSNSSQGWLEIRIQSNSGRENIIRNDFISTMVVDFRKDLHFYFHRLHIFKRPAWVTSVSRLVRMTDNCWDVSMCCQCAVNVLSMCCQCAANVLGTWGVNFPTHWFNLRITCSMPSCLWSGFSLTAMI